MQELRFVKDDSDRSSLVLRVLSEHTDGSDAAEYFLPVTDELTDFLGISTEEPEGATDVGDGSPSEETPSSVRDDAPEHAPVPVRERIHLRPKEIQDRIRHGETVEKIVAETGMEDRRVRPFAVPIAMERNRIAEMARDAHPVRADGPTDAPLREVLAGAFAARGESARAAEWSAAMDSSDHWIISVSWTKGNREGASKFVADFRFVPGQDGPATAEPVNSVASDLIDPRFERPVRTVSPVIPESRLDDDFPHATPAAGRGGAPAHDAEETRQDNEPVDAGDAAAASEPADDNTPVDLFGRRTHPSAGDGDSSRRKKKAVTPHWEDVLLGVRTNPKANGRNKKK